MFTMLIVITLFALIITLPTWPYSMKWGYFPSGLFTLVTVALVFMVLTGRV